MVEDTSGNTWILTDKYGMYLKKDGNNSSMQYIDGSDQYKFKSALYDAKLNVIWIGTYMDGLKCYNIDQNKWISYSLTTNDGLTLNEAINDIKQWNGKLYLGTSHGVIEFDPKDKAIKKRTLPGYENIVFSLVVDSEDRLWIGGIGIFVHDLKSGKTTEYFGKSEIKQHNPRLNFIKLFQDSKSRIWAASLGGGFYMLNDKHPINYNSQNIGLINDFTSFIGEVDEDILLIGTNNGLAIFDIKNNRCYNYNRSNGLGMTSARSGTVMQKKNGDILIGGMDGIELMRPSNLHFKSDDIDITFDKLIVNNQLIIPQANNNILKKTLPFVEEVALEHNQTNISLEIASFDFSKPYPIFYEYRLQDSTWTPFKIREPISFMNLAPGNYKLQVRATLNKSSGQYKTIEIPIKVKAAWYATIWAKAIYIIVALLLAFWLMYFAYSKMLMKQMLIQKEKENLDRMRFFINISHEIRTPLTLIIGQLELFLKKNAANDISNNKNIVSTYNNARRMEQIVSNLLDFEKQNQGYSKLSLTEVDIEIEDSFAQYATYRTIDFRIILSETSIPMMIDRVSIQRVFSNLLINAFKYTPDNGKIEVIVDKISCKKTTDCLSITFRDNGTGIPEESLPRIFDPFYQDQSKLSCIRHNHGTGIGLALSKGIVELHHGTVSVTSSAEGTAFTVTLPLGDTWFIGDPMLTVSSNEHIIVNNSNEIIDSMPVTSVESDDMENTQKFKMLIVEDDKDLRAMLKSIFHSAYHVVEACDGEEGFTKAINEQPDIVISDVLMPVMNGLNLCMKLKQDFQTSHIPIILLTAQTGTQHTIEGINIGADDYITKPFNIEMLEARCTNLLNNRRLLQLKYSSSELIHEEIATNDKDAEFVSSVIDLIETHLFTSALNVSLLCQELNMGKTLLSAKIKGITGHSPGEFIEVIRLKKAASMLQAENMNISEIAYNLGFSSPKYFTIRFKKLFGKTPTAYMQENE